MMPVWRYDELQPGDAFIDTSETVTFLILDVEWDPYVNEDEYVVSWIETRRFTYHGKPGHEVRRMRSPPTHGRQTFIGGTKL